MMALDIARGLDPARWFYDADLEPDDWQERAMRSRHKRQAWNVSRQVGKTTTAGLKGLAKAQEPDSLTLVISPSQRQSAELLRKVVELRRRIPGLPEPITETAHRIEWAHGGRILSLPSSETTIRGYSNVALLILDEASRIADEMIAAVRPMLAVSDGELVCLSTPAGRRGFFYENWAHGGETWERFKVTAYECDRISAGFLEAERAAMGESLFRQEYLCEFLDDDEAVFPTEIIDRAFTEEVKPLWQ
jgi:hypothetical protein